MTVCRARRLQLLGCTFLLLLVLLPLDDHPPLVLALDGVLDAKNDDAPLGFLDAVEDPGAWRREMERRAEERRAIESEELTDDQLRNCVSDLLDPERAHLAKMRLEHNIERSVPFLIEALADDRFREARGRRNPFVVVCALLRPHAGAEMVPPLAKCISSDARYTRKTAALLLAKIGTMEALEPVTAALRDDDDFMRSYALMGISEGIEAGLPERAFR